MGLVSAANQLIMVLFLTYFMLLADQLFKRKLVEIVGTPSQKKVQAALWGLLAGGLTPESNLDAHPRCAEVASAA